MRLYEWIGSSCVLILIVLVIRQLFKNILSARVRYAIWLLVMLRLFIPFSLFDTPFSFLQFFSVRERAWITEELVTQIPQQSHENVNAAPAPSVFTEQAGQWLAQEQQPETGADLSYENLFLRVEEIEGIIRNTGIILWGAGMIILCGIVSGSNLHFYRKLKKSRVPAKELQTGKLPPVYFSDVVPAPCMFGLFHPAIYLRKEDAENKENLPYILKHEYTHYLHKDHIWAFFRSLCLILHWYNPLVWAAVHLSRQDAELACDESVICSFDAAKREAYGRVLILLSAGRNTHMLFPYTASLHTARSGKRQLEERIRRISKRPGGLLFSGILAAALCTGAFLFTFTGCGEKPDTSQPFPSPVRDKTEDSYVVRETEEEKEPAEIEFWLDEYTLFINDYLADMNGDGVLDILRISSVDENAGALSEPIEQALRTAVEENHYGYYQIMLYDGSRAMGDEGPVTEAFRPGTPLAEDAVIETFELAQAHMGNSQYSLMNLQVPDSLELGLETSSDDTSLRGFLICNNPYIGQDYGSFSYEIFTYTEDWQKINAASGELSFDMNQPIPADDAANYTMELKNYLDQAVLLMDTSQCCFLESGPVNFTTCLEDVQQVPDAFAIWHWTEQLRGVESEETLLDALPELVNIIAFLKALSSTW